MLDDFDALLHFTTAFAAAPTGLEKLELLFANHIEHRPAVARAIAVLCGWGIGQVDFGGLNLIGALCSIPLAFALAASARGTGDFGSRALRFAPAALFAFQPQYGQPSAGQWHRCRT